MGNTINWETVLILRETQEYLKCYKQDIIKNLKRLVVYKGIIIK